jgi:hypothetical protein
MHPADAAESADEFRRIRLGRVRFADTVEG